MSASILEQTELRCVRSTCGTYDYILDAQNETICFLRVASDEAEQARRVALILSAPLAVECCRELLADLGDISLDEDDPLLPVLDKARRVVTMIKGGAL